MFHYRIVYVDLFYKTQGGSNIRAYGEKEKSVVSWEKRKDNYFHPNHFYLKNKNNKVNHSVVYEWGMNWELLDS